LEREGWRPHVIAESGRAPTASVDILAGMAIARLPLIALHGAARRGMKNDAFAGVGDLVDLYAVKMRQQPADDLITPTPNDRS
jgi:hypothetical protein